MPSTRSLALAGVGAVSRLANHTASTAIPTGEVITTCNIPGVVALTFDDGPYLYTGHVLDLLDRHGGRATFFVNGDNWDRGLIDDPETPWPATLRRMVNSGNQIASHTYSHLDLSWADVDTRKSELDRLDKAISNVLGYYPTYLRPPYGSCNQDCLENLGSWGYHVIEWNVDTQDWANNQPDTVDVAMDRFDAALEAADPEHDSFIVLGHDVHEQTAYALVEYMLTRLGELGYRAVTVGECLADPRENWYRS